MPTRDLQIESLALKIRCMEPLRLIEFETDGQEKYALLLDAGTTSVDALIEELGHEPNGYFWEGIAELLVRHEAPELDGRFYYDPEGGMFDATGSDRAALERLATLMAAVANSPTRLRQLVDLAEETGFEFDD